jgi:hypothetical protein
VLPEPLNATAAHPAIDAPPSRKLTLPVGELPVTEAVKVTLAPEVDGLSELATLVALVTWLTVCVSVALVDPLLLASPP